MRLTKKIAQVDAKTLGLGYGFLGVLSFSLTLPATRVAVTELHPMIVGLGRGFVAALLAAAILHFTRQRLPTRSQFKSLLIIASGVVLGFPVLSAWAMQQLPAAHGAVILGLLPLMTAIAGTILAGERPSLTFWVASTVGSMTVVVFALISGFGHLQLADIALLISAIAGALGYAEGGKLARVLGGWQVICWALVITLPFLILPVAFAVLHYGLVASPSAWLGFGYVSIISQLLGFFPWYQGLAIAGVARVGQIQLLQPFLTILASALLLHEQIAPITLIAASLVFGSVSVGRQAAIERK
ncbi:MAG: DMT family transporter [Aphanothece sp. CMT-3BRIN-NPC111]|nr:DMT family transporter [Aphanothece sp. CMT-3BRIN-NPC111]